jgi:hypothetical protein
MAFMCRTFHGETEVVVPKRLSCAAEQCLLLLKIILKLYLIEKEEVTL